MTRLCTCADAEAVAARAAREIAQLLERAREQRGRAHVALSGGTTPARTYELLAAALADWSEIDVWFADERCVNPDDEQSNYRMARETLLDRVAIVPERIHRMEGERGPEQGAARYAQALREHLPDVEPGSPVLDVIVLGIGPDGHVASLFPGAPALDAGEGAVCLGVLDSPKPPPQRITLSLAVLRAARRCLLLATGSAKRTAVTAALAEPTRDVPASLLRRERLSVILDDAASPSPP
ncbi:MAG TPA: 6-phosphogluconolactonase [Solirubrobacteraceae bacterium]|jgi:6-phosphogluconolactonase